MAENPLRSVADTVRRAGLEIDRIGKGVLKVGGTNIFKQACFGVSVRVETENVFLVEMELTLDDDDMAEDTAAVLEDLRSQVEEFIEEPYELSSVTLDPLWEHWRCTISQRTKDVDEAATLVQDMLEWEIR